MSVDAIGDVEVRVPTGGADGPASVRERDRLVHLAAEFESMLMLQMLKEMRKAGSWDEGVSRDGLGAQTMLDTIDVELASHLSKAQGLGLGRELLDALARSSADIASEPGPRASGALLEPGGATGSTRPVPVGVPAGKVTSGFGWRLDPLHGAAKFHRGVDIRAAYGQDVPAAGLGRVVSAGPEGGYGLTVVVEHEGGIRTRYAHLSALLVAAGDELAAGHVVGRAGDSGRATGPHLHFEVLAPSGEPLNPAYFEELKPQGRVADSRTGTHPGLQEKAGR